MSRTGAENPFDRFDLDPTLDVETITTRMRELAAELPESERQPLRDAWESLTLEPRRRIVAALSTFIDHNRDGVNSAADLRATSPKLHLVSASLSEGLPPESRLPVASVHGALRTLHPLEPHTLHPSDRLLEALLK